MKNKVLVRLLVPEIDEEYSIFLPVNKKIGNLLLLLNKAICEITNGEWKLASDNILINKNTGQKYEANQLLLETDIRNGSELLLLS